MRHLLTLFDVSPSEINTIFATSEELKKQLNVGRREPILAGHVLALLFEKPSLRTRVSFEAGMSHMGGTSMFLGQDVGWGKRESASDFGRVLSSYVDAIVIRAFDHEKVVELAQHCTCPVINGLTDYDHPCQALADLFTMQEEAGPLANQKLAYVGDSNNVARSLAVACAKVGAKFAVASPDGYGFDEKFLRQLAQVTPGWQPQLTTDPAAAVEDASAVYTDVWASMGQEKEREIRQKAFAPYQVNAELMKHAPKEAIFLHCLPARRGEEVTDEVIDSPQSRIVEQAANRMHVQKGILAWLLGVAK